MKILSIFTFLLCMSVSEASPLVGYSIVDAANTYQIVNAKKETIFKATADTIKKVELRDGLAVVQTSINNVSLIREDGKVLVDSVYGSEFAISKKLLSVFNKGGIGAVYSLDGKKLFPADNDSQTRPVQNIWIANDRYAVMHKWMDGVTVYGLDGEELLSVLEVSKVLISDGFLALVSTLGTLSLYDADLNMITSDSGMTQLQISDEFAGYIDAYGTLRLYSRISGEFPMLGGVDRFSLTNTFALIENSFGLTLYGKDKDILETSTSMFKNKLTSHALFARVDNTGVLWVKNEETGDSFAVHRADAYAMSDDLLVVKNGMGEFSVYSLKAGSFGTQVHFEMDQTVAQFQVGNGIVSFESKMISTSSLNAKILAISGATAAAKSVLVDEMRVNRVSISVNREEWNWK